MTHWLGGHRKHDKVKYTVITERGRPVRWKVYTNYRKVKYRVWWAYASNRSWTHWIGDLVAEITPLRIEYNRTKLSNRKLLELCRKRSH